MSENDNDDQAHKDDLAHRQEHKSRRRLEWLAQAGILTEALPYMRRYNDETIVIKYGGHAMGDRQQQVERLFGQPPKRRAQADRVEEQRHRLQRHDDEGRQRYRQQIGEGAQHTGLVKVKERTMMSTFTLDPDNIGQIIDLPENQRTEIVQM